MGNFSEFAGFLRKMAGLYLSEGNEYGSNGEQFVRMSIAYPREQVWDGMERFKQGVEEYENDLRTSC